MSAEETGTRSGGGRTARSFTAREDLVQALVSLGVTRNAATRVLKLVHVLLLILFSVVIWMSSPLYSLTCCKMCFYCSQVQCVANQLQYNSLRALCTTTFLLLPDRCNPWPHKPAIVIMTSLSLWHSCTYGARSPRSHYDVILIMTSFTAGHAQRYGRTYVKLVTH